MPKLKIIDLTTLRNESSREVELYYSVGFELAQAFIDWPHVKQNVLMEMIFKKHNVDQAFMDEMQALHKQTIQDSINMKSSRDPKAPV